MSEIPTLYKAFSGYKCLLPTCINALMFADEGHVACKDGHLFVKGSVYTMDEQLI